jgi:hypothetical protein
MRKAGGYILILSPNRQHIFDEYAFDNFFFAEPVPDFTHSRRFPLICFVLSATKKVTHLARGKRGVKAGTGLRRLNLEDIKVMSEPLSITAVIEKVPIRVKGWVKERFQNGGLLTPKSFEAVVDAIRELSPETRPILDLYSSERAERVKRLSPGVRRAFAFQKEAVAAALSITGLSREPLQQWTPESVTEPVSFIEGLREARAREDAMVINDLINLPGYDLIKKMLYNAAVFQGDSERLTVILANRQPLEQLLGTDLIYFNETYKSFVMVQYKAMEKEKGGECFRLPNQQLAEEISRMDKVLTELKKCDSNDICDGFRLNDNPFFLKLCYRTVFQPDDIGLFPGMYIPIDYWRILENDPSVIGPRGGRKVTYENVGRYFTNTDFISMVAKSWVGTTVKQSGVLKTAIRHTLEAGKAVALAIKTDDPDPETNEVHKLDFQDSEKTDNKTEFVQMKLLE